MIRIVNESFNPYFNLPLVEQAIREALEQVDLAAYVCGLDSEALIKLLLQGREDAQPCN